MTFVEQANNVRIGRQFHHLGNNSKRSSRYITKHCGNNCDKLIFHATLHYLIVTLYVMIILWETDAAPLHCYTCLHSWVFSLYLRHSVFGYHKNWLIIVNTQSKRQNLSGILHTSQQHCFCDTCKFCCDWMKTSKIGSNSEGPFRDSGFYDLISHKSELANFWNVKGEYLRCDLRKRGHLPLNAQISDALSFLYRDRIMMT